MLGPATGNTDTQDSPRPGLGGSHHLPPYRILCDSPRGPHPNDFSLPGLLGLSGLWSPITLRADLGSKCGLKQSYSSRRELSNGMSHVVCSQVFRVDSRLLVVGSQNWQTPGSSTPGPSFGHNLCFRCPNEQCEPILDICASRAFHWYKKRHKPLRFDPQIGLWSFGSPPGLHLPKRELPWECEGSLPHTFLHSQESLMWLPGFPLARTLVTPFALVASPKLGLRQQVITIPPLPWFLTQRLIIIIPQ